MGVFDDIPSQVEVDAQKPNDPRYVETYAVNRIPDKLRYDPQYNRGFWDSVGAGLTTLSLFGKGIQAGTRTDADEGEIITSETIKQIEAQAQFNPKLARLMGTESYIEAKGKVSVGYIQDQLEYWKEEETAHNNVGAAFIGGMLDPTVVFGFGMFKLASAVVNASKLVGVPAKLGTGAVGGGLLGGLISVPFTALDNANNDRTYEEALQEYKTNLAIFTAGGGVLGLAFTGAGQIFGLGVRKTVEGAEKIITLKNQTPYQKSKNDIVDIRSENAINKQQKALDDSIGSTVELGSNTEKNELIKKIQGSNANYKKLAIETVEDGTSYNGSYNKDTGVIKINLGAKQNQTPLGIFRTFLHESQHALGRVLFGNDYNAILDKIAKSGNKKIKDAFAKLKKYDYELDSKGKAKLNAKGEKILKKETAETKRQKADEVISHMSENNITIPKPIINAVISSFRRRFNLEITEADVLNIIRKSRGEYLDHSNASALIAKQASTEKQKPVPAILNKTEAEYRKSNPKLSNEQYVDKKATALKSLSPEQHKAYLTKQGFTDETIRRHYDDLHKDNIAFSVADETPTGLKEIDIKKINGLIGKIKQHNPKIVELLAKGSLHRASFLHSVNEAFIKAKYDVRNFRSNKVKKGEKLDKKRIDGQQKYYENLLELSNLLAREPKYYVSLAKSLNGNRQWRNAQAKEFVSEALANIDTGLKFTIKIVGKNHKALDGKNYKIKDDTVTIHNEVTSKDIASIRQEIIVEHAVLGNITQKNLEKIVELYRQNPKYDKLYRKIEETKNKNDADLEIITLALNKQTIGIEHSKVKAIKQIMKKIIDNAKGKSHIDTIEEANILVYSLMKGASRKKYITMEQAAKGDLPAFNQKDVDVFIVGSILKPLFGSLFKKDQSPVHNRVLGEIEAFISSVRASDDIETLLSVRLGKNENSFINVVNKFYDKWRNNPVWDDVVENELKQSGNADLNNDIVHLLENLNVYKEFLNLHHNPSTDPRKLIGKNDTEFFETVKLKGLYGVAQSIFNIIGKARDFTSVIDVAQALAIRMTEHPNVTPADKSLAREIFGVVSSIGTQGHTIKAPVGQSLEQIAVNETNSWYRFSAKSGELFIEATGRGASFGAGEKTANSLRNVREIWARTDGQITPDTLSGFNALSYYLIGVRKARKQGLHDIPNDNIIINGFIEHSKVPDPVKFVEKVKENSMLLEKELKGMGLADGFHTHYLKEGAVKDYVVAFRTTVEDLKRNRHTDKEIIKHEHKKYSDDDLDFISTVLSVFDNKFQFSRLMNADNSARKIPDEIQLYKMAVKDLKARARGLKKDDDIIAIMQKSNAVNVSAKDMPDFIKTAYKLRIERLNKTIKSGDFKKQRETSASLSRKTDIDYYQHLQNGLISIDIIHEIMPKLFAQLNIKRALIKRYGSFSEMTGRKFGKDELPKGVDEGRYITKEDGSLYIDKHGNPIEGDLYLTGYVQSLRDQGTPQLEPLIKKLEKAIRIGTGLREATLFGMPVSDAIVKRNAAVREHISSIALGKSAQWVLQDVLGGGVRSAGIKEAFRLVNANINNPAIRRDIDNVVNSQSSAMFSSLSSARFMEDTNLLWNANFNRATKTFMREWGNIGHASNLFTDFARTYLTLIIKSNLDELIVKGLSPETMPIFLKFKSDSGLTKELLNKMRSDFGILSNSHTLHKSPHGTYIDLTSIAYKKDAMRIYSDLFNNYMLTMSKLPNRTDKPDFMFDEISKLVFMFRGMEIGISKDTIRAVRLGDKDAVIALGMQGFVGYLINTLRVADYIKLGYNPSEDKNQFVATMFNSGTLGVAGVGLSQVDMVMERGLQAISVPTSIGYNVYDDLKQGEYLGAVGNLAPTGIAINPAVSLGKAILETSGINDAKEAIIGE